MFWIFKRWQNRALPEPQATNGEIKEAENLNRLALDSIQSALDSSRAARDATRRLQLSVANVVKK
jgi:hypothetical protein